MSRETILQRIQRSSIDVQGAHAAVTATAPQQKAARSTGSDTDVQEMFAAACARNETRIHACASCEMIPATVGKFIDTNMWAAPRMRIARHPLIESLAWDTLDQTLSIGFGAATADDHIGVNVADCAIADTGTVILASSPYNPTTLAFLTEVHVVVIEKCNVVATLDDALERSRLTQSGRMPRAVNLISGASRTADIESKIVRGAHGPRQLHVVMLEDKK